MTNLYSNRGLNDSDEEDHNPWGFKERGLEENVEIDDVEEKGFEPRQQEEDDIFLFKQSAGSLPVSLFSSSILTPSGSMYSPLLS